MNLCQQHFWFRWPFNKKLVSQYIDLSFEVALLLLKKNNKISLINGPINKKKS